jgi:hypothetical protein
MKYVYIVWFRDIVLPENDSESLWPACFVIEGESAESAQKWGDSISSEYAKMNEQAFVESAIEPVDLSTLTGIDLLPVVKEGSQPTKAEIGW